MKFLYKLVSIGIKPEQANKVKFKTRVLNAIGLSTITIVLFYTIFYFMGGEDETFLIPLSSYLLTGISIVTLNYFNKADWTDYALHILFPISFVLSSVQLGNQLDVEYFLFLTGIGVLLNTATFSQRTRQVIFSVNLLLFISLKIYLIYQPEGLLTMNENSMPYLNLLNGVVIFTLLYFMISTMFNFSFRLLKKLQYVKSNQEKIIEERTQELKQKTQDLERSVSELERFSYIAAHDLREPLRTVKSFSQLAKRDIKKSKTDNLEEYLTYVEHGVNRLDVLTKDIVKYVEIEDLTQKKEEVIVSDLINGIVANLQKESHKKIELSLVGDSPVLMINEYLAHNLFENLITNAVENCDKPIVQITINIKTKMDNSYHFWIQDNGKGIEEKYYDLIFEMFKRLENNIHKSGSGIGLAICKKIVERHQGKIWVESEIGVGSTFHFTIKA